MSEAWRQGRIPPKSFPIISVTATSHNLIQALEHTAGNMRDATTPTEIGEAYADVLKMRERLYTHIAYLEQIAEERGAAIGERNIHLRFK